METSKRLAVFRRMFKCDTARISTPTGKMFLIIGWNRNTKQDLGQWFKDGTPYDFDYVKERVIASGRTGAELMRSAKEYRRLLDLYPDKAEATNGR